jgi:hypothetical protein
VYRNLIGGRSRDRAATHPAQRNRYPACKCPNDCEAMRVGQHGLPLNMIDSYDAGCDLERRL